MIRSIMTRRVGTLLLFFLVLAHAAGGQEVKIAELDWDGARAIQSVLKHVLENQLGVPVVMVPQQAETLLSAMDRGEIDVFPDLWLPAQATGFARYIAPGSKESILVNAQPYPGTEGFYVPAYVIEQHGVTAVSDLAKPEIAKLFDSDGDGRGEYWPGPEGWSATAVHRAKARSYGFAGSFTESNLPEAAFKKEVREAFRTQRPIVFYGWTPDGVHASLDLRPLSEPAFDGFAMASMRDDPKYKADGCWNMVMPSDDADWLNKSRVRCASPPSTVYVAYTKALAQRSPDVARFLNRVRFDGELISGWIVLLSDYGMTPDEVAKNWVEGNLATVGEWLGGGR